MWRGDFGKQREVGLGCEFENARRGGSAKSPRAGQEATGKPDSCSGGADGLGPG